MPRFSVIGDEGSGGTRDRVKGSRAQGTEGKTVGLKKRSRALEPVTLLIVDRLVNNRAGTPASCVLHDGPDR